MKSLLCTSFILLLFTIAGCSGSDVYSGAWKAMDRNGNKWDMVFEAKSFTMKDTNGVTEKYEYTQNSIKIENSIKSYGIRLKDGRAFKITFPLADNSSKGIISLETSEALYTIGRTDYVDYNDLLKF